MVIVHETSEAGQRTGDRNKIAVVIREDLPIWKKLNVTAFLASGIAASSETIGEPYVDGSARVYSPMFGLPVIVYTADQSELQRTLTRAATREVKTAIFTDELFLTFNDEDNRAAVAPVPTESLSLAGIALFGSGSQVDKVSKGLKSILDAAPAGAEARL